MPIQDDHPIDILNLLFSATLFNKLLLCLQSTITSAPLISLQTIGAGIIKVCELVSILC